MPEGGPDLQDGDRHRRRADGGHRGRADQVGSGGDHRRDRGYHRRHRPARLEQHHGGTDHIGAAGRRGAPGRTDRRDRAHGRERQSPSASAGPGRAEPGVGGGPPAGIGGNGGEAEGGRAAAISGDRRGGDSGSSRGSTPSEPSAAATALAMTPPTGMMPPSPAPLAPSGLVGEGRSSSAPARIVGKSLAVGSRESANGPVSSWPSAS